MKIRGTEEKTQANTGSLKTCSKHYSVVLRKLNPNLVEGKTLFIPDSWKKYINLVIPSTSGNESVSYLKIWWPAENCLRSF